ncbi:hypothetical protein EDC01DRAFT_631799 [Geopyxis carbonaria]|nr:hypothetical protein EDC01DRAFT_631799 [Geopyxis carbonaria]
MLVATIPFLILAALASTASTFASFLEEARFNGFHSGGADNSTTFNSTINSKTASGVPAVLQNSSFISGLGAQDTPTNGYDWRHRLTANESMDTEIPSSIKKNNTSGYFPVRCLCTVDALCGCNEQQDKGYWKVMYEALSSTSKDLSTNVKMWPINDIWTVVVNGTLGAANAAENSTTNCEASGKTKEQCADEQSIAAGVKAASTAAIGVVVVAIGFFIIA